MYLKHTFYSMQKNKIKSIFFFLMQFLLKSTQKISKQALAFIDQTRIKTTSLCTPPQAIQNHLTLTISRIKKYINKSFLHILTASCPFTYRKFILHLKHLTNFISVYTSSHWQNFKRCRKLKKRFLNLVFRMAQHSFKT